MIPTIVISLVLLIVGFLFILLASWLFDNFGWYRKILFAFRCLESLSVAFVAAFGVYNLCGIILSVITFLITFPLYFYLTWHLLLFLFDIMSEIRYSVWSRFVVRGYRKLFHHLQPQPAEVPVDGSRYNVPIILGSIVLIAEIVACIILL